LLFRPVKGKGMCRKGTSKIVPHGGSVLVELLVAMTVTAFFAVTLLQTVCSIHRCITHWEQSIRLRQTVSAIWVFMSRDIRMAGCNPFGTLSFPGLQEEAGDREPGTRFILRMDKRGRDPRSPPDGDIQDPDERIEYRWDLTQGVLRRNGQPVALKIRDAPEENPLFKIEVDSGYGLLTVFLSAGNEELTMNFIASAFIRNPL